MSVQIEIWADPHTISFAPVSLVEEIAQNVRIILQTEVGSVPLDRDFGLDLSLLDRPTPVVRARLEAVIVKALRLYEPRVEVLAVSFTQDGDGKVTPKVKVKINDS